MSRPAIPHATYLKIGNLMLVPVAGQDTAAKDGSFNHVLWAVPGGRVATTNELKSDASRLRQPFDLVLVGRTPR